jgi:hypothetical protein
VGVRRVGLVAVVLCLTVILLPVGLPVAGRLAPRVWSCDPAHAAARSGSSSEADRKAVTRPDRRRERSDQEVEAGQGRRQSRTKSANG